MGKNMSKKNDDWPKRLDADIKINLGVETETYYDLLGSMRYVTEPKDGKTPLSNEVHAYIEKWMGYNTT